MSQQRIYIMKRQILFGLMILGAVWTASATIYTQGTVSPTGTASGVGTFNTTITDGNPIGIVNQITVSGSSMSAGQTADIQVTLNVSGGVNSDLYAYLSYNGSSVVLLNRIGVSSSNPFGDSGSGLNNVVLSDAGSANIHTYASGALSGTYKPDGNNISPLGAASSFSANVGTETLDATFGNMSQNGTWTLYFADVVAGGGNETLNGWSLDITAVPEPVNVALAVFGVLFVGGAVCRFYLVRARSSTRKPISI
jgi:hypothetical protein